MSAPTIQIQDLFEIPDHSDFLAATFKRLLERPISAMELHDHLKLLLSGMSRQAVLYLVSRSEEFAGRYTLPDDAALKRAYQLSRVNHKLHALLQSDTAHTCSISFPFAPVKPSAYSSSSETDVLTTARSSDLTEFSALSLCQMSQLPEVLSRHAAIDNCRAIGSYAGDLLEEARQIDRAEPGAENLSDSSSGSSVLLTDPALLHQVLLAPECLNRLLESKPSELIFTMPSLPYHNHLAVVWDETWFDSTSHQKQLLRWNRKSYDHSSIYLINDSSEHIHAKIYFNCLSLTFGCALNVSLDSQTYSIQMDSHIHTPVVLDCWLRPGCSTLCFHYAGRNPLDKATWAQAAQFAIADLRITDVSEGSQEPEMLTDRITCYQSDAGTLGSGYYPYLISDQRLRSSLHKNGFFEISAYRLTSDAQILPLHTTRYSYSADQCGQDCWFSCGSETPSPEGAGVTLYLARRTGVLKGEVS